MDAVFKAPSSDSYEDRSLVISLQKARASMQVLSDSIEDMLQNLESMADNYEELAQMGDSWASVVGSKKTKPSK